MPDRPGQSRLTRCRTGCMRCRVRRRKCDEGKPRCRNCIDRNFQCQYGPQLTFLSKNAHTIQASQVAPPSAGYEAIRFINEEPQKDTTETEAGADDNEMDDTFSHTDLPSQSQEATDSNPRSHAPRNEDVPSWSEKPVSHIAHEQPSTAVFSDKDESAVAGLLALGTSMNEPDLGIAGFAVSSPKGVPLMSSAMSSHLSYSRLAFSPQPMHPPRSIRDELSPTEIQALLRHYRYEVASWVRPRTARITDFHSAAMSPLWHAQRVCSISLHNDRRECWDPCLLASFFVAARRMTHESQQQEVLRGFNRIRTVTGWNTHDSLQGLRAEWGLLDET
ncbi:hypothetical protein N7508_002946 [Penicillium antarcticum]|uniref:uncharacterized protein n=1 Tax=Penicillium antarcticum TaxID=416450 RepID=UPI00239205FB|nr:uncharacterized protein N7508_002946 [Penicillium antarcticum]KAJ5312116.1 hypothetical protein N7508_002946 [Penicillium antarcticum]